MTSFYTKLSENILNSAGYKAAATILFNAYMKKVAGEEHKLERDIVRKLTTSLQYFYQADNDHLNREGSEILSMLLYVATDETPELIMIAEHVFNETGDFPNIDLLREKFPNKFIEVSIFDKARKIFRKSLNTVKEIDHPLTDYQRNLWEYLVLGEDIITSAPTSTGKTHIILKYLITQVANGHGAFAAIVVPTRALISEVAAKVHSIAKETMCENDIEVCTFPKEGAFKDKSVFVMTQERLSETLQVNFLTFDYLFIDEAHSISDKGRGVLLHMTIEKFLETSNPQIIISMPSPKYLKAFNSVFKDTEFLTRTTTHSPVAKIFIETRLDGRNIVLAKKDNPSSIVVIDKKFQGSKLANIVYRLGKGESNIVYSNKTNECEKVADDIATLIPQEKNDPRLAEAADYVSKFIHPNFTLADNLKKGVAFHYGPLPGVVRQMVESLAREGVIDFIACTSTLAEGINLPARNLFLKNPMQFTDIGEKAEKLEEVRLNNITGRAGRMLEHFAGNIFLVEPDKWKFKDYFDPDEHQEDKIATYYQVLNDDVDRIINILKGRYEHSQNNTYTYYSVANKLLREFESDEIAKTLSARELKLSPKHKNILLQELQNAYDRLEVSPLILAANPTIGYLQQNNLLNFLREQKNLSNWALPHPMDQSLYDKLTKICSKLCDFGIFLPNANSIMPTCVIAKKWIQGSPLYLIVAEQMSHFPERGCNRNVRNVITIINNDIRFKMASALRCYQFLLTYVAQRRGIDINSVKLHGFIEIGGCDDRFVQLVNLGLSRETALEVHRILGKNIEVASLATLRSLHKSGVLDSAHRITQKEIENLLL